MESGLDVGCGVKNTLEVTNSPLNLTKTGSPSGKWTASMPEHKLTAEIVFLANEKKCLD